MPPDRRLSLLAVNRGAPYLLVLLVVVGGCGRVRFEGVDTDGATSDAAAPDPPVTGCPTFALFCDDFELGNLGRWSGTVTRESGTVEVVGTRARSGSFALHSTVDADPSEIGAANPFLRIAPQTTGVIAVRQWINLASPLSGFSLVSMLVDDPATNYLAVGGDNSGNWVSTEESDAGQFDHRTTVETPGNDVWTCVELVFTFPGAGTGRVQIFVDDAEILDVESMDPAPEFEEVHVGITRGDEAGFRAFTDDVVIASQRIGCS